ncbi:MAG: glycosyltransferase family 2 protein [Desulfurococcaceae archaeon]
MVIIPQNRVAIIILTFNSISKLGSFFNEVLESVFRQNYLDSEIIIVDNGSSDGTPDYVENTCKKHSNCKVLRLRRNYGWSRGNNLGALLAKNANYLFFMNDDVILERDCLRKLVDALLRREDLAAVQPLIVNRDGTVNCGLSLGLSGLPKMVQCLQGYPSSTIFYVSGAALLTRADVFFRVGMFDDDLFLYHDDADYSWRLRLTGYKVACVTNAKAYHWGSATLGSESPQYLYFLVRNNIWIIAKNSSLAWILPRIFLMLIEVMISFLGHMLFKKRDLKRASIILRALIDGFRNLRVPISKRANVAKIRRVKEREINRAMNISVDVNLIFPRTLRRAIGLR